jgi:hypothetical protein
MNFISDYFTWCVYKLKRKKREEQQEEEYNAKGTKTSFQDGYSRGVKHASRDLQGLNGHGYDSSCPKGHTSVFCGDMYRAMITLGLENVL